MSTSKTEFIYDNILNSDINTVHIVVIPINKLST